MASSPFARRYLENRCFFLFLELLRCFSSPRFLLTGYVFTCGYLHITAGGFPHSDICGSSDICSSPQLIAACHVLHRLPVPRHPPYALSNLTKLRLPVASGRSFLSLLLLNVKCLVFSVEIVRIYPNSLSSLIYFRFLTNTLDFSFLICFHSFIQFSMCTQVPADLQEICGWWRTGDSNP